MVLFKDRVEAGRQLAEKLKQYKGKKECVILAIPRGGVAVGYGLAKELKVPLGIIVARKLPIPWDPEAGFGAIVGNEIVLNKALIERIGITKDEIDQVVQQVKQEIKRRAKVYDKKFAVSTTNKVVILVDDGLASGFTMLAALRYIKKKSKQVIVAIPVASAGAFEELQKEAKVIAIHVSHEPIFAVANFYEQFPDLTDEEVINYLEEIKRKIKCRKKKSLKK